MSYTLQNLCLMVCLTGWVLIGLSHASQPVLILTIGHSGSKTLVKVLNQHSQIHMEGELLFHPRYKVSLNLATQRVTDIFSQSDNKSVHGFKLLYHQIWFHPIAFFTWLKDSYPQLKIIHLVRSNYLEHYLSFYEGKPGKHDIKEVLDHISDSALRTRSMTQLVHEHKGPTMTLLYEDLVQQPERYLRATQEFLGVSYEALDFTSKEKLNERLPWERVPDWPLLCKRIQERQQLDGNLENCLERWSVSRWESEVRAVGDACLLQ